MALVTKSANDVAVAVAEYLGGTEQNFAVLMTAKARSIGMRSTVFRNASGLPDPGQVTTARDMALLGLALRKRFPQYYSYFSVQSFSYRGRTIRGHNDLIGDVQASTASRPAISAPPATMSSPPSRAATASWSRW